MTAVTESIDEIRHQTSCLFGCEVAVGEFSSTFFENLARVSSVRAVRDGSVKPDDEHPNARGYTHRQIIDVEDFKNAMFLLAMYRARAFMKATHQDGVADEGLRVARASVEFCFTDDFAHDKSEKMFKALIIPTTVPAMFDQVDNRIEDLCKKFGTVYTLACKN